MDDLANKLAISKKTFYQHFESKIESISSCQEYLFDDFLLGVEQSFEEEKIKEIKSKVEIIVLKFIDFIGDLDHKVITDFEQEETCQKIIGEFTTQFKNFIVASLISDSDFSGSKRNFEFITTLFIESILTYRRNKTDFEEIKMELKDTFIDLFIVNVSDFQTKETLFDTLMKQNRRKYE